MKKFLLSLFCIFSLTTWANYDPIINIPDANFKALLLSASPSSQIASTEIPDYDSLNNNWYPNVNHKIDLNNDGEIQLSEALSIKQLKLINSGTITNFIGLEAFINLESLISQATGILMFNFPTLSELKYLTIYNTNLNNIDFSIYPNLIHLDCTGNQLSSLNVQLLPNLIFLSCVNNQLSNLNIQGHPNLIYLSCEGNQLSSLNIQGLINLKFIYCHNNQLSVLDFQGLTNLKQINCSENQLININVQGLNLLESLICEQNQLSNLNLQGLSGLQSILCRYNQMSNLNIEGCLNLSAIRCGNNLLTALNLEGLINLTHLSCHDNQLSELNLQGLSNLVYLYCQNNSLNSLNLNGCLNLIVLDCNDNQLTNLNVEDCVNLISLNCNNNQLTSLFIKNSNLNVAYTYHFSNNPNLQYVCCSDNQLFYVQQLVDGHGYTNCQVNSYCSFTPGGNYNTITGQLKYDVNQNGCDVNDEPLAFQNLLFSQGSNSGFFSTNQQGQYYAYAGSGTHTITPQIENPSIFNITPPLAQITFPDSNNNTQTQNFCITPTTPTCSHEVLIMPLEAIVPGFDVDYKLIYRNTGNMPLDGEVVLPYDSNIMTFLNASVAPNTNSTGLLKWNFSQLMPFENRSITLKFNMNTPTHPTHPLVSGDLVCINPTLNITSSCGQVFQPMSVGSCFEVVNAYDPNDKTCLQGNTPGPELIGQYVHYLIRFENTGTYFAENVVIRDDIDLTKFDINSLVVLDASHNMLVTRITNNNRVEFIFEGIQLPFPPSEERHGYVLFKIKTKADLTVGSTFSNQAGIYFDYNHPIITNNETSTFTVLGTPSFEFSDLIALYPNPANDVINLSAKAGINLKSIEIYNTLGQLLMALPNDSNERRIDVSHLTGGTYMIKVYTDQGQSHTKFVKK